MAHNAACKNRRTAIQIIKMIAENMRDGTQKAALQSVAAWIQEHTHDFPDDPEERRALMEQLEYEINLTKPRRKETPTISVPAIAERPRGEDASSE